ncbi:MAG TPA: polysaccharide biosynthesis tyrosine autokinase [Candidatus Binataceae bacterium]|jgi:capsular exopolysaccharide synthesis family protein|nr:polysaccharide biosynthesis tyrosine autokinase [Candidatus Binataceae bacterium]
MSQSDDFPLAPIIPPVQSGRTANQDPLHLEFTEQGLGLWECWLTVRKRMALVLGLTAGGLTLALLAVVMQKPRYTASATLLIQPETPQILDVTQLVATTPNSDEHDFYKTQEDLLRSPALAAKVIRVLALDHTALLSPLPNTGLRHLVHVLSARVLNSLHPSLVAPPPDEADLGASSDAISRYLEMLSVSPVLGTQLVTVAFTTTDPVLAARIANAHAHSYIDWGLELRHQASGRAQHFLRDQLVEIKQRVEASEAALNSYRHSKGIVSFAIDDKDQIAETRMAALTTAFTDAQTDRIRLEAEMQLVRAGDYDSLPLVINNPMIATLKPQIDQLAGQYAAMATNFTDKWPELAKLKAQVNEARLRLSQEIANVTKGISREYRQALGREQALSQAVDQEKEHDLELNDAALQDAVLEREVETNRKLYEDVLKRMQEMGVAEQAPLSNENLVNAAVTPRAPSHPKVLKTLSITGLIASITGIGLAFFLEQNDGRFKDAEEIDRVLHLPRLAVAPDYLKLRLGAARARPLHEPPHGRPPHELISFNTVYSPNYTEPYRMIRVALLFSRAGSSPRTILFTSAIPQEGKTLTVSNTALISARMGARTLLVDADLRRPQCHRLFSAESDTGLSDVLVGQTALTGVVSSPVTNLSLLCAGSSTPNPSALLVSTQMRSLLEGLSTQYDCVLVDSAPVLSASDTTALATMVDGVVLVIGQDTPRQAVLESYARLLHAGAHMLGFVFNRVDFNRPQHRSHKQYYRYHNYYAESAVRADL